MGVDWYPILTVVDIKILDYQNLIIINIVKTICKQSVTMSYHAISKSTKDSLMWFVFTKMQLREENTKRKRKEAGCKKLNVQQLLKNIAGTYWNKVISLFVWDIPASHAAIESEVIGSAVNVSKTCICAASFKIYRSILFLLATEPVSLNVATNSKTYL